MRIGEWQLNGGLALEVRGKNRYKTEPSGVRSDVLPGNLLTLDLGITHKLDSGVTISGLAYAQGHVENDQGIHASRSPKSQAYGIGMGIGLPITENSGLDVRFFTEHAVRASTQGTRLFVTYGIQL